MGKRKASQPATSQPAASGSVQESAWKRKQKRTPKHPMGCHVLRYDRNRRTRWCAIKGCNYIEEWLGEACGGWQRLHSYEGAGAYDPNALRPVPEPAIAPILMFAEVLL